MIGLPYIQSLFTAVLAKDSVIQGRLFSSPRLLAELNMAAINDVITAYQPAGQKYPCVLLMAAKIYGNMQFADQNSQVGMSQWNICLAFVRPTKLTAYNTASEPLNADNANVSTHTIFETVHDMQRCATNFLKVLHELSPGKGWYISEQTGQQFETISEVGNDLVAGGLLHFTFKINQSCGIEGYPSDYLTSIVIPPFTDSHPQHINS